MSWEFLTRRAVEAMHAEQLRRFEAVLAAQTRRLAHFAPAAVEAALKAYVDSL